MSDEFKFGSIKIIPVPSWHENAPEEMEVKFDQVKGIAYVREEDWPLIKAEIANLPTRQ